MCAAQKKGSSVMLRCLITIGYVLTAALTLAHAAEGVRHFDNDKDGKADQWEYYRGNTLLRVESDRNRDGRADEWTFGSCVISMH
jgi:hypothetical protein